MGQHMLALAKELRDLYNISLVCPPDASCRALLEGAVLLGLDVLPLWAPYHEPQSISALCEWLQLRKIDIFHCHAGISWEGFGGIDAATAAGVRTIIRTEHLPYLLTHPQQQLDHERIVQAVDALVCVCEESRASYIAAGVPPGRVRVVYNGISPIDIGPDRRAARMVLGLPDDARVVMTVGRLAEQKGYNYLLEAVPTVISNMPDVYFAWVGDGPLESSLKERAKHLGVADRVLFLGRRNDAFSLMAGADLFVLPSLFEGLPISMLEAMSLGLPVVGTRVCGTSELVADGETGVLVSPQDSLALAQAIGDVLACPDRAAHLGAAGRRRVSRHFSVGQMVRNTDEIYRDLLHKHRAGPNSWKNMNLLRGSGVGMQDVPAGPA